MTGTPLSPSASGATGEAVAAAGGVAPDAEAARGPRPRRKPWVTVVVALVVVLLLIAAILLLPRLFTVYVAPVGGMVLPVSGGRGRVHRHDGTGDGP